MTEDTSSNLILSESTDHEANKLNCSEVSAFHGHTRKNLPTYHDWENSQDNVRKLSRQGDQISDSTEKLFNDSSFAYGEGELPSSQSAFHSSVYTTETAEKESLELKHSYVYSDRNYDNPQEQHSTVGVKKSDSSDDTSKNRQPSSVFDGGYVEEDEEDDDEEVFQGYSQQPRRRTNSCASFLFNVSIACTSKN